MEKSLKSVSINYGLYLGLILSAFTIIAYAVNIELLVNFWIMILLLPLLAIVFGIISSAKSKSILGGFMSFKQAFSSYFITVAIGIIISTLVTIILFSFIDPDAAAMLQEIGMEKARALMERFGAPESEIEKAMAQAAEQDAMGISTQLLNIAKGLIFYAVIGLIVALIMKKKDPNEA
ncbi:DUF4199 domain-containing protein [Winogradskyella echinorum]|uniref:DUF4199 domain-containing protein n=1 Tax=Winogradskyella echinorum TaxID=538189 RepID=A0ABR6Y362_9FLAO|nr:DUF4199 domain-containing protein [Winogradskyella echinorum]MBC3847140.1 DUF4199 domain-containing protein [Winogradskyella echinorum]MBC5751488.1 DUF4199 domain-containing protein [Winogradskyella echinorum]